MEDPTSQSTSGNSLISKVRSVITLEPAIFIVCTANCVRYYLGNILYVISRTMYKVEIMYYK